MFQQHLDHMNWSIHRKWWNKLFVQQDYWIQTIEVRPIEGQIDDLIDEIQ